MPKDAVSPRGKSLETLSRKLPHIAMTPPRRSSAASSEPQPELTRVNGIGMWNSWTRNFRTPLLALLDLLDNSFDAAIKPKPKAPAGNPVPNTMNTTTEVDGFVVVEKRRPSSSSSSSSSTSSRQQQQHADASANNLEEMQSTFCGAIEIDADAFFPLRPPGAPPGTPFKSTTGICITNNSHKPIKPLVNILEAYSSAKGRDDHGSNFAETIGENGVGLKQGCATLSDLSFVLSRSEGKLSLGIIASRLQKKEGIYLPSFELNSRRDGGGEATLRREMEILFTSKEAVAECVREYGEGSLEIGISRLINHFQCISEDGGWGHHEHVFRVILHNLKHGPNAEVGETRNSPSPAPGATEAVPPGSIAKQASNGPTVVERAVQMSERANFLMREVKKALPIHYIHVPPSFEFRIDGEPVDFLFWERRLVEFTSFYQYIDPNMSVQAAAEGQAGWKCPKGRPDAYCIRIMCGFDPTTNNKKARLFIYSRQSGRLVKEEIDCRGMLGMVASGSDFCQGLTILVDDMHGHLPLNPTKQDVAFGEQANGNVHKSNLFMWISAYAHFFYKYHLKNHGGLKTSLSNDIESYNASLPANAMGVKAIDISEFTEYVGISWKYIESTGNIRCSILRSGKQEAGADTLWKLDVTEPSPAPKAPASGRRKRHKSADEDEEDDIAVPMHNLMVAPGASLQIAVQNGFRLSHPPRERKYNVDVARLKAQINKLSLNSQRLKSQHNSELADAKAELEWQKKMMKYLAEKNKTLETRLAAVTTNSAPEGKFSDALSTMKEMAKLRNDLEFERAMRKAEKKKRETIERTNRLLEERLERWESSDQKRSVMI